MVDGGESTQVNLTSNSHPQKLKHNNHFNENINGYRANIISLLTGW